MKRILYFFSLLILSCSSDNENNTLNIIGVWEFDYAEVLSDSEDEVLFYNWNYISNCFNGTKFTFLSNGDLVFNNLVYDIATEQCVSSNDLLYNFTWESLGNSDYRISYTYIDELDNPHNTFNNFKFQISNSVLIMTKEDESIISYWNRL